MYKPDVAATRFGLLSDDRELRIIMILKDKLQSHKGEVSRNYLMSMAPLDIRRRAQHHKNVFARSVQSTVCFEYNSLSP